jgi:hypothetical protein
MDVTLGPWTAAHPENKPLAEAMGDEAWKMVEKTAGFTPKKAPPGATATKGYTVSGRLTNVNKQGNTVQIFSAFTILVDGGLSNVPPIQGTGSAEGSSSAEDAVRAITESRIKKILDTLKTGRVVRQG